jgi:hypothetical protein
MDPFNIATFAISAFSFFSGKKDRKRERIAAEKMNDNQLLNAAREIGRTDRHRASLERGMYAAAGISTESGSGGALDEDAMIESVHQQEAILAGLSDKRKGQNPHASIRGNPKAADGKKVSKFGQMIGSLSVGGRFEERTRRLGTHFDHRADSVAIGVHPWLEAQVTASDQGQDSVAI